MTGTDCRIFIYPYGLGGKKINRETLAAWEFYPFNCVKENCSYQHL